jgi:hypothetical protein
MFERQQNVYTLQSVFVPEEYYPGQTDEPSRPESKGGVAEGAESRFQLWRPPGVVLRLPMVSFGLRLESIQHLGKSVMTPEHTARERIDAQLGRCGWSVPTKDHLHLSASRGVAVCELSFATGGLNEVLAA